MAHASESEKASRYIAQLDDARCNARWSEVPELARKVEKHAPHRKCLTITARSEAAVASFQGAPADASTKSELQKLVHPLLTAIDEEKTYPQDLFQASVCLGWIHWAIDEPGMANSRLPRHFENVIASLTKGEKVFEGWGKVCMAKGIYIKGYSFEKTGTWTQAINTYSTVLPYLNMISSVDSSPGPFRFYVELLLARLCLLSNLASASGALLEAPKALTPFRVWARLFDYRPTNTQPLSPAGDQSSAHWRRGVWRSYYETLSNILQRGMIYTQQSGNPESEFYESPDSMNEQDYLNARTQQRAELKRVEWVYESILLKETRFPEASQSNEEIEKWIELVVRNWRTFCGPLWEDEALGDESKASIGAYVLEMLYRAATKTYHSTQILRHLFIIHASLAEFDLAFKAFDSYVDIVTRTKDRAERSGEQDDCLDSDDVIIKTAAEAIRILCRFGKRKEVEKARDVASTIEKWLNQPTPAAKLAQQNGAPKPNLTEANEITESSLSPRTLAIAYRAMGTSQAHWARLTYEAPQRAEYQSQAVNHFKRSLDSKYQDSQNLEALYSLGLLLAETRDLVGGIKLMKQALLPTSHPGSPASPDGVLSEDSERSEAPFARERQLVPLWHLLALLLTARSEYATATKFCEAAFEQFLDPVNLFGTGDITSTYKSSHLNDLEKSHGDKGLVDRMLSFEKENIIQVKMTQLSLIEALDGPSAAVDASDELLALYARLFGHPKTEELQKKQLGTTARPPKTSGRNSIFSRSKSTKKFSDGRTTASTIAERPATVTTEAPTIHVTNDDIPVPERPKTFSEKSRSPPAQHGLFRSKSSGGSSYRRTGSTTKLRKKSISSIRTSLDSEAPPTANGASGKDGSVTAPNGETVGTEKIPTPPVPAVVPPTVPEEEKTSGNEPEMRPIAHNMPHESQPPPAGHLRQPPVQDVRLPPPMPRSGYSPMEPRFPSAQEKRHRTSLLVNIWLFIASMYCRAGSYDDANGAVDEANKLVKAFETEVAKTKSSAKAFSEPGWGGGKSVDELWADVWQHRGELALARSNTRDAAACFEKALSHYQDHPEAIVSLSNMLLDSYSTSPVPLASSPEAINRLAARDRAYSLLSSLTKLGTGWDYSEAWFALARAYEEGGQIEKAKEVLWWCVDLEDTRPLRVWKHVARGGFVLL